MKKGNSGKIALLIEIAVILAVMPRWIPALMRAEGLGIPAAWLSWWTPMSALFSAGMAVTEAVAIAYTFRAWQEARGSEARRLLLLTVMMLATFSVVLAPFSASSIGGVEVKDIISNPRMYIPYLFWGTAVVLSTGITVMAVGVAQTSIGKRREAHGVYCWCGEFCGDEDELEEHKAAVHEKEIKRDESPTQTLAYLQTLYQDKRAQVLPPMPELVDVARAKKQLQVPMEDLVNERQQLREH